MPAGISFSGILWDYLNAIWQYWWILLVGSIMPLLDALAWFHPQAKKFEVPHKVRLAVAFTAVLIAQFLAYRDNAHNLSVVIGEKQALYTVNDKLKTDLAKAADEVATFKGGVVEFREPPTSLRRRTIALADELSKFWADHPSPALPIATPQSEDDKARNAAFSKYWREVESTYYGDFRDRVVGVVREYKNKGVPTGYLEEAAHNHPFGGYAFSMQGSPVCSQDELCEFRELAFHVDGRDQLIGPRF